MESLREEVKMKQEEVGAAYQKCAELQKVIEDLQLIRKSRKRQIYKVMYLAMERVVSQKKPQQ